MNNIRHQILLELLKRTENKKILKETNSAVKETALKIVKELAPEFEAWLRGGAKESEIVVPAAKKAAVAAAQGIQAKDVPAKLNPFHYFDDVVHSLTSGNVQSASQFAKLAEPQKRSFFDFIGNKEISDLLDQLSAPTAKVIPSLGERLLKLLENNSEVKQKVESYLESAAKKNLIPLLQRGSQPSEIFINKLKEQITQAFTNAGVTVDSREIEALYVEMEKYFKPELYNLLLSKDFYSYLQRFLTSGSKIENTWKLFSAIRQYLLNSHILVRWPYKATETLLASSAALWFLANVAVPKFIPSAEESILSIYCQTIGAVFETDKCKETKKPSKSSDKKGIEG